MNEILITFKKQFLEESRTDYLRSFPFPVLILASKSHKLKGNSKLGSIALFVTRFRV